MTQPVILWGLYYHTKPAASQVFRWYYWHRNRLIEEIKKLPLYGRCHQHHTQSLLEDFYGDFIPEGIRENAKERDRVLHSFLSSLPEGGVLDLNNIIEVDRAEEDV